MAQIYVIGRITSDIEVKSSQKGNDYVRFDIAENIGSKDRSRTQYFQVWAFNENARKLIASKTKKGSLVAVSGSVELETYTKQDGLTIDKRLKIYLNDWKFVNIKNEKGKAKNLPEASPENTHTIECIDGERDDLPS